MKCQICIMKTKINGCAIKFKFQIDTNIYSTSSPHLPPRYRYGKCNVIGVFKYCRHR
ncbi:unnamed protein product [Tenebrio molitor]|nr:unnamed protein product [Tenebrio molitor]